MRVFQVQGVRQNLAADSLLLRIESFGRPQLDLAVFEGPFFLCVHKLPASFDVVQRMCRVKLGYISKGIVLEKLAFTWRMWTDLSVECLPTSYVQDSDCAGGIQPNIFEQMKSFFLVVHQSSLRQRRMTVSPLIGIENSSVWPLGVRPSCRSQHAVLPEQLPHLFSWLCHPNIIIHLWPTIYIHCTVYNNFFFFLTSYFYRLVFFTHNIS